MFTCGATLATLATTARSHTIPIRCRAGADQLANQLGQNGDDDLDVVVPSHGRLRSAVTVLLGGPEAGFEPPVAYKLPGGDDTIATGDFDGDGDLDLAVALYYEVPVALFDNLGDGTFVMKGTADKPVLRSGLVAAGDVDGDGLDDLVTEYDKRRVGVQVGNGDFTFQDASRPIRFGTDLDYLLAADIDADDGVDLLVQRDGSSLVIRRGDGGGSFGPAETYLGGSGDVAIADLDGVGRPDLVHGTSTSEVGALQGHATSFESSAP
jgi:hypothetical protein